MRADLSVFARRLAALRSQSDLAGIGDITRGIEKESLRVTPDGVLAATAHPEALGSALAHPQITTDYSEALLEFITPPEKQAQKSIDHLDELHRLTCQNIGQELLWANSMPCVIGGNRDIPIAQYGQSNSGRMKMVYREGLGHRYGRSMQVIAGIHFNFSPGDHFWEYLRQQDHSSLPLQDYKTAGYFRLIRNFHRYFWLLIYLYGAAPAVCRSFVKQRDEHSLVPVGNDHYSLHTPWATSLRMGDLGYQSSAQQSLVIPCDSLESYSESLCQAITTLHPEYEKIGVRDAQGHYRQLNANLLQIENEFYSVIRPKRTSKSGETPLAALNRGGVEYIEVRCLDLNPFEPTGISTGQIGFLDVFLLFCLLEDSPGLDQTEYRQSQENQRRVVYQGRDPELQLYHYGQERTAREWGFEILETIAPLAEMLDTQNASGNYRQAIREAKAGLADSGLTPSARILDAMQSREVTFYHWAMEASRKNREHFSSRPLDRERLDHYAAMAARSIQQQADLEATDQVSFETFVNDYYRQYCCNNK